LTRARTSTLSVDSMRPVYSSHSMISRTIGVLTVIFGSGAAVGAGPRQALI
jgi:hypothetical protein